MYVVKAGVSLYESELTKATTVELKQLNVEVTNMNTVILPDMEIKLSNRRMELNKIIEQYNTAVDNKNVSYSSC